MLRRLSGRVVLREVMGCGEGAAALEQAKPFWGDDMSWNSKGEKEWTTLHLREVGNFSEVQGGVSPRALKKAPQCPFGFSLLSTIIDTNEYVRDKLWAGRDKVCLSVRGNLTASPKLKRGHLRANFALPVSFSCPFPKGSLRAEPHFFPYQQEGMSETPSPRQLRD